MKKRFVSQTPSQRIVAKSKKKQPAAVLPDPPSAVGGKRSHHAALQRDQKIVPTVPHLVKDVLPVSLSEPLPLIEGDLPEWDSPLLMMFRVPPEVRAFYRAMESAAQRWSQEAPPLERQKFEEVKQRVKQQGGWTPHRTEEWKVLLSALLYDEYRQHGESLLWEKLPPLWQAAPEFFGEQWWLKDLLHQWRQDGKEGKEKIQRLSQRKRGQWQSPQDTAKQYHRSLPLFREIENRLQENQQRKMRLLGEQIERGYEKLQTAMWILRKKVAAHPSARFPQEERKADRLVQEGRKKLAQWEAIQAPSVRVGYTRVLRQVTALQEEFGCLDRLALSTIRKYYEQYEARKKSRRY